MPSLARALVPVVLLVHEFASYTRPKSAMRQGLDWATEIVFSADLVARSAYEEHPSLNADRYTSYLKGAAICRQRRARVQPPANPGIFVKCFGRQGWKMRWSCWVAGMFISGRAWIYSCHAPPQ